MRHDPPLRAVLAALLVALCIGSDAAAMDPEESLPANAILEVSGATLMNDTSARCICTHIYGRCQAFACVPKNALSKGLGRRGLCRFHSCPDDWPGCRA
jgi:hypothetical protein